MTKILATVANEMPRNEVDVSIHIVVSPGGYALYAEFEDKETFTRVSPGVARFLLERVLIAPTPPSAPPP